jgi:hypothetical protein
MPRLMAPQKRPNPRALLRFLPFAIRPISKLITFEHLTVNVGSIADLLDQLRPEIESQLKPNLQGIFGGVIRRYLPQAWAFKTETETVTLTVDSHGNVSTRRGGSPNPDVLVKGSLEALSAALSARQSTMIPAGAIDAKPLTPKGDMAFRFLRDRFGL